MGLCCKGTIFFWHILTPRSTNILRDLAASFCIRALAGFIKAFLKLTSVGISEVGMPRCSLRHPKACGLPGEVVSAPGGKEELGWQQVSCACSYSEQISIAS